MATQRMTVATIAGEAGQMVARLFRKWHSTPAADQQDAVRALVDEFAEQLRRRGGIPPIVYYCEWFDCWSMGYDVQLGLFVEGKQFGARCGPRRDAMAWSEECGNQFPEQQWLAMRLCEAAEAWQLLAEPAVVVILRQVLGASYTDEEVVASLSDTGIFASRLRNSDE